MNEMIKTFDAWISHPQNKKLQDQFQVAVYFCIQNSSVPLLKKLDDNQKDLVKDKIYDYFMQVTVPKHFLSRAKNSDQLPGFLTQVTQSRTIDGWRRMKKNQGKVVSLKVPSEGAEDQTRDIPDHTYGPEALLEKKEARKTLTRFMNQLGPLDKQVAQLKFFQGLTSRAMAKELRMDIQAIYNSTSRIMFAAQKF